MNRAIKLECTHERYGGYYVLTVLVARADLAEWCLDLVMLYTDVIQALSIVDNSDKAAIQLVLFDDSVQAGRGRAVANNQAIDVTYPKREFLGWLNYYLLYYRDGAVGADHFDVDLPLVNCECCARLGIVFKAADVGPPLTVEEANKLLED